MRILVIYGDCIEVNSSASLCNIAYLRGLVDAGHDVTLISADGRDYSRDSNMVVPAEVKQYTVYSTTLYEKLSLKKNKENANAQTFIEKMVTPCLKTRRPVIRKLKKAVFSLYGVHSIYLKFSYSGMRFHETEKYDVVLSLATPAASHLLAHRLLKFGHVKARHWIQVWEDPWYAGVDTFTQKRPVYWEEKRLLSFAHRICYVSPLTLMYQKQLYPEYAEKMYWVPLPAYYTAEKENEAAADNLYGYFGEYSMPSRDLEPFYMAAEQCGAEVNICGNSNRGFKATGRIHIYPRLSLEELRPIEDKTGVLVFLCNRHGGQIPGKIYQYAATGKTILFILDGTDEEKRTLREFFEPFHRFVFCENSVESISEAMRRIRTGDLPGIRNCPLNDFTPEKIVQRILTEGMR